LEATTKKDIFFLIWGVLSAFMLVIYSPEINKIAPIIKENLFEILMLGSIGFIIIKMLAPSENKQ